MRWYFNRVKDKLVVFLQPQRLASAAQLCRVRLHAFAMRYFAIPDEYLQSTILQALKNFREIYENDPKQSLTTASNSGCCLFVENLKRMRAGIVHHVVMTFATNRVMVDGDTKSNFIVYTGPAMAQPVGIDPAFNVQPTQAARFQGKEKCPAGLLQYSVA